MSNQDDGSALIKTITYDLKEIIEKHLGVDAFSGIGTQEERASKISVGIIATTMLLERLVAVALVQKLEKCPEEIEAARKFIDKMTLDMNTMLKQHVDTLVTQAMEQIAFVILSHQGSNSTEH